MDEQAMAMRPKMPLGGMGSPGMIKKPSMTEALRVRKASLEADLAGITAALESLEKHPEVAEALDAVSRVANL